MCWVYILVLSILIPCKIGCLLNKELLAICYRLRLVTELTGLLRLFFSWLAPFPLPSHPLYPTVIIAVTKLVRFISRSSFHDMNSELVFHLIKQRGVCIFCYSYQPVQCYAVFENKLPRILYTIPLKCVSKQLSVYL